MLCFIGASCKLSTDTAGEKFSLTPHVRPGGLMKTVLSLGLTPPGRTEAVFRNPPIVTDSPPHISDTLCDVIIHCHKYLQTVSPVYRLFHPFTDGYNRVVCKNYRLFLPFADGSAVYRLFLPFTDGSAIYVYLLFHPFTDSYN